MGFSGFLNLYYLPVKLSRFDIFEESFFEESCMGIPPAPVLLLLSTYKVWGQSVTQEKSVKISSKTIAVILSPSE